MATLSKTARASMQAGEGSKKRTAVAWVWKRKSGKLQTRPFIVCFTEGEAEAIVACDPENLYYTQWSR
jgi:hypothetical protein